MGPVGRFPRGLLSLFELKTLGDYPGVVTDSIACTYDISLLLAQADTEFVSYPVTVSNGALVNHGAGVFPLDTLSSTPYPNARVPQNEVWLMCAWGSLSYYSATVAGGFNPVAWWGYIPAGSGNLIPFNNYRHAEFNVGGAGQILDQIGDASTIQVIPAGSVIAFTNARAPIGSAGGVGQLTFAHRFTRLRV